MKIYATNFALDLVEANIIEPLETRTRNSTDSMVRYQKVLFPTHEDIVFLSHIWDKHWPLAGALLKRAEGAELGPMAEIYFGVGSPVFMLREEVVFGANDLAFEKGGECGMVICEALNA